MAMDSAAVFTFNDPFEETHSVDLSSVFFTENPTLGPPEISLNEEQNPLNYSDNQIGNGVGGILEPDDPLSDPVIWAFCNGDDNVDDLPGNSGVGSSGFAGEGYSNHGVYEDHNRNENPVFEDQSVPLSFLSAPVSQYNCICCQRLREITHTNGIDVKRLEIHGRFGVITHAILGKYDFDSSFQTQDLQMFDFQKENMQLVKKFLVQYYETCKQEGYNTIQDPLSTFYEALCVGLNEPNEDPNHILQFSQENPGDCTNDLQEMLEQPVGEGHQEGFMKIPLAMQRERTRNLKLKDFVDYFDLPIEDAARKMNICPTVVKKICRKNGVLRWPYRKIKSLERKISHKSKMLSASDCEERTRAIQGIQMHKRELASIYNAFTR